MLAWLGILKISRKLFYSWHPNNPDSRQNSIDSKIKALPLWPRIIIQDPVLVLKGWVTLSKGWITIQQISVKLTYFAIYQIETHPVDSVIRPSNNRA